MDNEPTAGLNRVVDLIGLANSAEARRPIWSFQGEDLNLNLIVLAAGETIDEHVNREVEVLLLGIAGEGEVAIEDTTHLLRAGGALIVPKGARRSIKSTHGHDKFSYLTCHRRRAGLVPAVGRAGTPKSTGA